MNAWLVSIAGVVALSVLLDIIVPEGETNKYIKGIFSLITIFVILSPIVSFVSSNMSIDDIFIASSHNMLEIDNNFVDNANQDINQLTELSIENYLNNLGYKSIKIRIYLDYDNKITLVTADINNLSIDEDKSHINITDKIKDIVSNSLKVDKEKVIIYGLYRG